MLFYWFSSIKKNSINSSLFRNKIYFSIYKFYSRLIRRHHIYFLAFSISDQIVVWLNIVIDFNILLSLFSTETSGPSCLGLCSWNREPWKLQSRNRRVLRSDLWPHRLGFLRASRRSTGQLYHENHHHEQQQSVFSFRPSVIRTGSEQRSFKVVHLWFRNPIRTSRILEVSIVLSVCLQKWEWNHCSYERSGRGIQLYRPQNRVLSSSTAKGLQQHHHSNGQSILPVRHAL